MSSRLQLKMGLEPIALALIFAPEPFSTVVGLGLLAGIKVHKMAKSSMENTIATKSIPDRFEDFYRLKVELARGNLAYNTTPVHHKGMLSHAMSNHVTLFETPAWQHYRKKAYSYRSKDEKGAAQHCDGILPRTQSSPVKLYETGAWQQYRKKAYSYLNKDRKGTVLHREGLLPRFQSYPVKLYKTDAWQQYHKSTYTYLIKDKNSTPTFSGIQKGLLKNKENLARKK